MDKKNVIVALLVVVIVLLAGSFWKDKATNQTAQNDLNTNITEPPAPVPTPAPAAVQPSPNPIPTQTAYSTAFVNNNWLVESITSDGSAVNMNVNVEAAVTLNFAKAKNGYSGFGGCNNYSGTFTSSAPNNFSFGTTAATKKACMPGSTLENSLFSAMAKIAKFTLTNDQFILESADGKTKITYKKAI